MSNIPSLFYDRFHYLLLFGLGFVVCMCEEEDHLPSLMNELITKVFVEQLLALPGSAKYGSAVLK